VYFALGDETRLRVVERLSAEGPLSITKLNEGTGVTRQALTKHLHVLADAGLVKNEREGRENVYRLEPRRLAKAQQHLEEISRQWDEAIDRLRAFVED
jgi:DNA-binding transcriptional ArsR family regulator